MAEALNLQKARCVSITFDDGFKHCADVSLPILGKYTYPATFYVVTGWVEPMQTAITEPYNVDRSHGTWDFWRGVERAGHEVGSHTFSHIYARSAKAQVFPWIIAGELDRSFADLKRELARSDQTISMPWNARSLLSSWLVRRQYIGCRIGFEEVRYNRLDSVRRYNLDSWAPLGDETLDDYISAIRNIPPGGWLILQFHSFDSEGWHPVTRDFFERICTTMQEEDVQVLTVRDALKAIDASA